MNAENPMESGPEKVGVEKEAGLGSPEVSASEKPEPTAEEREGLKSQIEEQEKALEQAIPELQATAEQVKGARLQAEQELENDPNALKPQLFLKKVEEAYDTAVGKVSRIVGSFGFSMAAILLDPAEGQVGRALFLAGALAVNLAAHEYNMRRDFEQKKERKVGEEFQNA